MTFLPASWAPATTGTKSAPDIAKAAYNLLIFHPPERFLLHAVWRDDRLPNALPASGKWNPQHD
jgi:hypothetical protein